MHPDSRRELKLALLLMACAALISSVAAVELRFDDLVASAAPGLLMLAVLPGLAGNTLSIFTPIWVDREGPQPVMAMGAAAVAIGVLVLMFAGNNAFEFIGIGIVFIGHAGLHSYIFYALAARGMTKYRGALIGALAAIFLIPDSIGELFTGAPRFPLGLAVAFSITAALLLYVFLRRLPNLNPTPDPSLPGFTQHWGNPPMRKALIAVGLIFLSTLVLARTGFLLVTRVNPNEAPVDPETSAITWALAVGALAIGLASDRLPASRLLPAIALLAISLVGVALVTDSVAINDAAATAFAFLAGGLIVLPYVLLAEHFPTQRFGTLCVQFSLIAGMPGVLVVSFTSYVITTQGAGIPAAVMVAASLLAAAAAWTLSPNQVARTPIPQSTD